MSRERVFRLAALLLEYPDDGLLAGTRDIRAAAGSLDGDARRPLLDFIDRRLAIDEWAVREEYVATFDFHKRASLHMSFYRDGDRRQRGATLLGLKRRFREAGFELVGGELPDYLPAVLEFAALCPGTAAEEILARIRPGIELLRATLHDLDSPYAMILDAVSLELPALTPEELAEARRIAAEGPPDEEVGLEPFAPPEYMPRAGAPL